MASQINASSHSSLVEQVAKLVELPVPAIDALNSLDRKYFTPFPNPYGNIPYPISDKQVMTDLFSQSIILKQFSSYIQRQQLFCEGPVNVL